VQALGQSATRVEFRYGVTGHANHLCDSGC
jgi:hypothetical protein